MCTRREKLRVWHPIDARGAVCCLRYARCQRADSEVQDTSVNVTHRFVIRLQRKDAIEFRVLDLRPPALKNSTCTTVSPMEKTKGSRMPHSECNLLPWEAVLEGR